MIISWFIIKPVILEFPPMCSLLRRQSEVLSMVLKYDTVFLLTAPPPTLRSPSLSASLVCSLTAIWHAPMINIHLSVQPQICISQNQATGIGICFPLAVRQQLVSILTLFEMAPTTGSRRFALDLYSEGGNERRSKLKKGFCWCLLLEGTSDGLQLTRCRGNKRWLLTWRLLFQGTTNNFKISIKTVYVRPFWFSTITQNVCYMGAVRAERILNI